MHHKYNVKHFQNIKHIHCSYDSGKNQSDEEDGDIDWIGVPLASVASLKAPEEFLPCFMEWSNHQMIMSDKACIRFTASSNGPIYFGLSAVPDKISTWYYFRITFVS